MNLYSLDLGEMGIYIVNAESKEEALERFIKDIGFKPLIEKVKEHDGSLILFIPPTMKK